MAIASSAVLFACASPLAAQTVLTGTVRQDSTGRPLAGIEVLLVGSTASAVTDASGRYVLGGLPSGRRVALFRSVGFLPVQMFVLLGQTDTVWANAMMIPRTVLLDPLVVTATPAGPRGIGVEAFEERRRLGFGKFVDSTELRRNEHRRIADVLRQFQGIGFVRLRTGGRNSQVAVSRRRAGPGGEYCYMSVYLDGVSLYQAVAPGAEVTKPVVDLQDFDVASLEAVELYRSAAEVPVEYGGAGASCGVILLWTRRGP